MLVHLIRACELCEHGSASAALRQIVFSDGRVTAFNGILQYQALSGLEKEEKFAVTEQRLAVALRSCSEGVQLSATKEFLKLKNGPLTVKVRKVTENVAEHERIALPKTAAHQSAKELGLALRQVKPFVSTDASRPWSVSVLIKDGYAWATNNLALVRVPVDTGLPVMKIPAPTVDFLCSLPELGVYDLDANGRLTFSTVDKALLRSPQAVADWPDVSKFFSKMPKDLPPLPAELSDAARTVSKLSDRFVSLAKNQIESKHDAIESEYEVDFSKGKGKYSARLLNLILENATHADFSFFPEPIFFKGEHGLEGTAVGMKS